MRLIARRHGATYGICEVMLDKFLVDLNPRRQKNKHYLYMTDEERPVGGQLMGSEPDFVASERLNCLDIKQLFQTTEDSFRAFYRHTPLWRTKRDGLLRNAAIALGNQLAVEHLDILKDALQVESPSVQDACRWAIAKIESAIA